jgi:hypothetical protein
MDGPFSESTRYEVKMTCPETYLPEVRSWVRVQSDPFVETYPPRQVNNVYLDNEAASSLEDHLSGVSSRRKLRFRWYGEDASAVRGNLELKCRTGRLGCKRYDEIPHTFDLTCISWHDWLEQLRARTSDEGALWLSAIVRPTLVNHYMREYLATLDGQIRLTIDYDIWAYDQLLYTAPNLDFPLQTERQVVIELKSTPTHLRRLSDILTQFPLRAARNSKYITGIQSALSR